jgi:hypothetical protein
MAKKDGQLLEHRDGYLYPVGKQFDITRDRMLVDKGSHIFCQGHLGAVPIEEQSRNPKYCKDCYRSLREG